MRKLSEIQDEKALDMLADLIGPVTEIFSDQELKSIVEKQGKKVDAVKIAIKNHKKAIIEILATLNEVPLEDYHCNILTLPTQVLEMLNDKDMMAFFESQGKMMQEDASGSAMENIEVDEQ